jgi:hypothetical protein
MLPAEPWETSEVPIRRHQLAAALDRERAEVGVGDEVPSSVSRATQLLEQRPVALPGSDRHGVRNGAQGGSEREGFVDRRREIEDARMRRDPHETRQDELGDTEGFVRRDRRLEPRAVLRVIEAAPRKA